MKRIIFLIGLTMIGANVSTANVVYKNSSFVIQSPYLNKPLLLGSAKLPVFAETNQGKFELKERPSKIVFSDSNFAAIWNFGQNKITANFVKDKGSFRIDFKSSDSNDIKGWGFSLSAEEDEYFTGLMERTVDGEQKLSWRPGIKQTMNLRGQIVKMIVQPTVAIYCPFFISSRNYSLFVKGTWPGVYDFCKSEPNIIQISFEGPTLSMVLNTAPNPAELVKAQSLNIGPTILPPKWAFGTWRWRDTHTQRKTYYDGTEVNAPYNSEVVEDILMMQALDIPLSIYWLDRPWALGPQGYDDFEWDPNRFPNAEKMIKWLEEKNIRTVLWIAPWVMGDMAKEAVLSGYNLKGQKDVNENHRVLVDFTNPAAVEWWQNKGLAKVLNQGIKGFKMDRAEEQDVPNDYENKAFDGRTSREYHNDYPVMYAKSAYGICKKICGDDFVLMPRAGYTGSSKYAVFWGGDIGNIGPNVKVSPEALRCAIIALQKSSIMGFPIWGSDTGGYNELTDHEVLARWLAFSCFCPIMEVGPTESRGLWDLRDEPHYDKELIAIWRLYSKLHEKLSDYSFELAKQAAQTGMPIVRPLFLIYPQQKQAWEDWQSYMYGPDILVSAVWEKGKMKQSLYLPAGEKWIDAWDRDKVYDGGKIIDVNTPLYKTPIFLRHGSTIDIGDPNALYEESMKIAESKPDLDKMQKMEFSQK